MTDARRINPWFQWGLAAATGGLLIGLISLQTIRRANEQHLLTELADSHMRSLVAGHLVDVPSSDRHVVAPWFDGKINFAPPVPELAGSGYVLVGGRVDYVTGHPAAALIYQLGKRAITVFIWSEPASGGSTPPVLAFERGYQIAGWTANGLSFRAVSDIGDHDLHAFAAAFAANTGP